MGDWSGTYEELYLVLLNGNIDSIDSHAHLGHEDFSGDVAEILERAQKAGVVGIIAVASDLASTREGIKLAEDHDHLFVTGGIHPHDVSRARSEEMAAIETLATHHKVVGIGETGLDYHYDFSPREQQRRFFARSAELACRVKKPLVIHIRESHDDVLSVLREVVGHQDISGVVHCFSGKLAEARQYLDLGLYLSFSGLVTFAKADEIRHVAGWAPAERILVETDAPYLAPVPHRGKRNEPAFLVHTIAALGQIRGLGLAEMATLTADNTRRLFSLPSRNTAPHNEVHSSATSPAINAR